MNSLKPQIYFTIHDWMITRLNLRGEALNTFAYIYATSKLKGKVTQDDIVNMFGISHRQARRRLKNLFDRGLLHRKQESGLKSLYWAETDEIHKKAFIIEI